jgi:hypothetical protein
VLIRDEATIANMTAGEALDAHRQDIQDTIDLKTQAKVTDFANSPTNPMRQWGNAMTMEAFEAKLATILPAFVRIFDHPTNPNVRCMHLALPDGTLEYLQVSWGKGLLPEHSIMYTKYEDVPDLSIKEYSARDMPKGEFISEEEGWKFDTSAGPLPGYKRVETVNAEAVRGWRTVLLKLILLKVITPSQAEIVFGADDRREWANKTGKQNAPTLW